MKIIKGTRGCVFCKQSALDELDFGELKVTKNLRAHYYCLLFSETITQSGRDNQGILGFLPSDILSELCRSKQKQCHYCKEFGATAGCANKFCNIKFHLSCGIGNKTQQNFDSFVSYCHKHRKYSNVPVHLKRSISDYQCVICLENFPSKIDVTNVIWADCCKAEILLHLQCMKKLALSAGYFTKCPGCNNKTEFITTIKLRGVFVPERDASWELTGNAYSELYYVHESCDAKKCICPHGRTFSLERGKWKIFLCKLCGSSGTHQFCSQIQKEFVCGVCSLVDNNSVIACGNATSTASNTNRHEINNPQSTSISLPCYSTENNENSIIDPLDDIIVVDCFDDSDEDKDLKPDLTLLSRISTEVTVKSNTNLNRPTTSNIEVKSSHKSVRRVATKSTTKLPYLRNKRDVLETGTDADKKIKTPPNSIILPQSSSSRTEMSIDLVKHDDCISKPTNRTSPERFKAIGSHSHKERRIATKSTTKLPFTKKEIGYLEKTIKLEKQTINSLDDFDDVIIIDSDEEGKDANMKDLTEVSKDTATSDVNVKTVSETTLNTPLKPVSSESQIERKIAVKSTTKLPYLKRKNSNDENTSLKQQFQCEKLGSESICVNKIINYSDIANPSVERPSKKFRSVAKMSTTSKSTSRLCNLIKKVHTVIGSQSTGERNNFFTDRDPLRDVAHSASDLETLCTDQNQLHYTIPLNVDSEIEFVNCPNFSVSGQEKPCQEQ